MKNSQLRKLIRKSITELTTSNEGVDNTCRNKEFCCQERYSRKNTTAIFQNGSCICPQGSIQTNCPRK